MPRKRPGAVRAVRRFDEQHAPRWARELGPIDRLSPDTSAAIRVVEHGYHDYEVQPGNTAQFLGNYRRFLRQPGSKLRLVASVCSSCPSCRYDDVAVVRDALQSVLCLLPRRPRAELGRLLADLDSEFRRRTLPGLDPQRWTDWRGSPSPWWHRRLYEGE